MTKFSEIALSAPLQRALNEIEYVTMTPVQAASLPAVLAGHDVLAQAATGSGKTAVFGLGLLAKLDASVVRLQGLVLCPTRELADQVSREIRRLARFIPNVKVLTLCGGIPLRPHLASLAHEPHLVVGTPGRILELVEREALPLDNVNTLVLDEADRMLDMGFADDLDSIIGRTPKDRQTLLFSATMPESVRETSRVFQREPVDVTVATEADRPAIEEIFFKVDAEKKVEALEAVLLHYRPESAVIFCNTRQEVRVVAGELDAKNFAVLAIHGELEQREREGMLVRFANRSCTVLVASDVAARGLDIADLAMVINFDIATDADTHLHRIGRTGRAGRQGIAVSLCSPRDASRLKVIEARIGRPIELRELPDIST
jgi:ATP-independent RNA helicase DbpA